MKLISSITGNNFPIEHGMVVMIFVLSFPDAGVQQGGFHVLPEYHLALVMQAALPDNGHPYKLTRYRCQLAFPELVIIPAGFAAAKGDGLFQVLLEGDADSKDAGGIQCLPAVACCTHRNQKDRLAPVKGDSSPAYDHGVVLLTVSCQKDTFTGQVTGYLPQVLIIGYVFDRVPC